MANPIVGSRTSLTVTGLGTLASATYVASDAYNCATNSPLDVVVEVNAATTNSPSGRKALMVFLQESLDGTTFRSGPTSGTSTTDERDLRYVGPVFMNSSSVTHTGFFSVYNSLGFLPKQFRIVLKNDLGVALTSGTVYTAEIA